MGNSVEGIFPKRGQAEEALRQLIAAGFDRHSIGIIMRDNEEASALAHEQGLHSTAGAVTGSVLGGGAGTLLAATCSLIVPGIGPFIAGGILATALYVRDGRHQPVLTRLLHAERVPARYVTLPAFTDDEAITKEYRAAATQDCRLTPGTTPDPAGTNSVAINVGTTCLQSAKRTYKALTWNASLDYQVSPDVLTYIATRRGFKANSR